MFPVVKRPSDEIESTQRTLYVLFFVGMLLAVLKLGASIMLGISEIIVVLMFLCGICCANYCLIVFYIVMLLLNMISFCMLFGRVCQIHIHTGTSPIGVELGFTVLFVLMLISVIYDLVAVFVCFNAYKTFKFELTSYGKDIEKGSVHPTQHLTSE